MELVKQHIDPQKLENAVALHNEINDDMTPKQTREALINVLDKAIDEFLVSKGYSRDTCKNRSQAYFYFQMRFIKLINIVSSIFIK
ncbi:hypothetical protein P4U65_32045 [Bacillus pacificus]|nr:hypothetical protein [Bacillus thuringiensis]MED1305040.1 hypothetical protein [Bacillus pacificus]